MPGPESRVSGREHSTTGVFCLLHVVPHVSWGSQRAFSEEQSLFPFGTMGLVTPFWVLSLMLGPRRVRFKVVHAQKLNGCGTEGFHPLVPLC